MLLRLTIAVLSLTSATMAVAAAGPVERVANGLLPASSVVGRPTRTMNLAERMKHHQVPAVSVAVFDKHDLAWSQAYGTLSSSSSKPATPRTLFQAGSLSKPVSAAAALMLAQRGKLSLDGPLSRHLRSWKIPAADGLNASEVTLRRVLSHTAGFNVHGFRGYSRGEKIPTALQVLDGTAPANSEPIQLQQVPGQALRYSGGGYVVLQQAIQDVTRQPFDRAVQNVLFRPLVMSDSTFSQVRKPSAGKAAIGHMSADEQVSGGWHRFAELAPAGLWTTPTDLARFTLWVMKGMKGEGSAPQDAVARQMTARQSDRNGKEIRTPNGNWAGLGLVLEGEGPAFRISHSGTNVGYKAIMVGFPETGQGAVVMANSNTSGELIKEILRSIAAEYRWPERFHEMLQPAKLGQETLQSLSGTYKFASREVAGATMDVVVKTSEGALRISLPDGSTREIHPRTPAEFVDPESGLKILFDEGGTLRIPEYGIQAKRT